MVASKVLGGAAVAVMLAFPVAGQAQDMQRMLGGLLTGNQNQDQAIRDAYERGYQKGRQDEARMARTARNDNYGRQQQQQPYDQGDPYRR